MPSTRLKLFFLLGFSLTVLFCLQALPVAADSHFSQGEEPTASPSATETTTPNATPTAEPTPSATPVPPVYFPLVFRQLESVPVEYLPTQTVLYCSGAGMVIPDQYQPGISSTILVEDTRFIGDLDISLDISHTWVGDLAVWLTHQETGKTVSLFDRPGYPGSKEGCSGDNIGMVLDDEITLPAEDRCAASPAAISGAYLPNQPLSAFDLERATGSWTVTVADLDKSSIGTLNGWCLSLKVSDSPAPPTPPPALPALPPQARINGISGQNQALPLDCESRTAVDWAGYFGVRINELKFFNQLPISDNPDRGFVGDVNGTWGQIPPNDYGIHAEPVAQLLREYGLPAYAHRPLSWDALRAEIAAGRPVYTFVIGSVYNGIPVYYTPLDGLHTVVARREHTVIVIGYSESNVTILDGASIYNRSIGQFLESWSALGNMAITASP
jgi:uncharacterized protein YvpB